MLLWASSISLYCLLRARGGWIVDDVDHLPGQEKLFVDGLHRNVDRKQSQVSFLLGDVCVMGDVCVSVPGGPLGCPGAGERLFLPPAKT